MAKVPGENGLYTWEVCVWVCVLNLYVCFHSLLVEANLVM